MILSRVIGVVKAAIVNLDSADFIPGAPLRQALLTWIIHKIIFRQDLQDKPDVLSFLSCKSYLKIPSIRDEYVMLNTLSL